MCSSDLSLEFAVHNEGAPIAEDRIATMFEPLQRGPDASQTNPDRSIGLGLFIVKYIVDAHGGRITVDSALERGTTFTVSLPQAR